MEEVWTVRAPQAGETPTTQVVRSAYAFRYAYARSDDTRRVDDVGQDYVAVRDNGRRFAFALCDGVSQSFLGDLAARLLGDALLEWLWQRCPHGGSEVVGPALEAELRDLAGPASAEVAAYHLPDGLPEIVLAVLEQKRALGSESTFVGGLIDLDEDRAVFAWMGDGRLRLWGPNGERSGVLGDRFLTRERWSTRLGPVGGPHVFVTDPRDLRRIVAYSDGFLPAAAALERPPSDVVLDGLIAALGQRPTSDDVSYVEWWPGGVPELTSEAALPMEVREPPAVPPVAPIDVPTLDRYAVSPVASTGDGGIRWWLLPLVVVVALGLAALAWFAATA
jgi:hypothetical protein